MEEVLKKILEQKAGFEVSCVKLKVTDESFHRFADITKHFLQSQVELDGSLTDEQRKMAVEWYDDFFHDVKLCRKIVEQMRQS